MKHDERMVFLAKSLKHLSTRSLCTLVLVLGWGCSQDKGGALPPGATSKTDRCQIPGPGCTCENDGETAACGQPVKKNGISVDCSVGTMVCSGGSWSPCSADSVVTRSTTDLASSLRPEALGSAGPCLDDPCNPYCYNFIDTPSGLSLPDGGMADNPDAGLILEPRTRTVTGAGGAGSTGGSGGAGGGQSCVGLAINPPTQTVTVTDINPAAATPLGEYFNAESYTSSGHPTSIPSSSTPAGTRYDATIDFNWNSGAPGVGGIGASNFSVRWTGSITPTTTGDYTFTLRSDDGSRMWLGNTLIVDKWLVQGVTSTSAAPVHLVGGQHYDFRVEYFQGGGADEVHLLWQSATIAQQVVPAANLGPASTAAPAMTVNPPGVVYTADALPAAHCQKDVQAAWTLDKLSIATIDDSGVFTLVSPVAGPIQVRGYAGSLFNSAALTVNVAAVDTRRAPSGTSGVFSGTSAGADPNLTALYPYANTVLPVGVAAPLIQWSNASTTATAVKIGLRYPSTGTPTFSWEEIIPETNPPQATIPATVWSAFDQTAKGGTGAYTIQRYVSPTLYDAMVRPIKFSTAPLRGRIVYTEYLRSPQTATIRTVDPSVANQVTAAFQPVSGCPVCHSMSADGSKFVTSDRSWSVNGGVSSISGSGAFTNLYDAPTAAQYTVGKDDWRGFAWAPLTPDGQYLLYANNFWGNTKQSVVGIDQTNRVVSIPATYQSGGTGIGLRGEYYTGTTFTGVPWVRTDPDISFTWSGSPGGPVPATNYSVKWSGKIQPLFTETYTFYLTTTDSTKLTIGGAAVIDQSSFSGTATTFTGTANLTAGQYYDVVLTEVHTTGTAQELLEWSSTTTARATVPQEQLSSNTMQYGLLASYYNNTTFSGTPVTRIEPTAGVNWGTGSPDPSIGADNFSDIWQGQIEAPYTGTYTFSVANDDTAHVEVGGTTVIDTATAHSTGSPLAAATTLNLTAGQKYSLLMKHVETSNSALILLYWTVKSGATTILPKEFVPMEHLYPPASYTSPTNGLWASYYGGGKNFNRTLAAFSGTGVANGTVKAFQRIDPLIDFNWGTGRPMSATWGTSTSWQPSTNSYSIRWSGQILAPCTGVYEFQAVHDDYARIYVNNQRVVSNWSSASTDTGAIYLTGNQRYDFKVDYAQTGTNAAIDVLWKPPSACGTGAFVDVPTANLFPTTYGSFAGVVRDGGENFNGFNYDVFSVPSAAAAPTDVTTNTQGNWGLEGSAMMVPTFSPDGTKLAYVTGDSSTGAGWRKGLALYDFDETGMVFKNDRLVVNTWPFGNVMRWPTFESDSHSIVFSTTPPASFCCINGWTHYGFMGPTDYYETPGWLQSVDTTATTPTAVPLANLNSGERALDANKAFQPTALPISAGGYRWVVFTSTRPYGNTLNLTDQQDYSNPSSFSPMLVSSSIQSMLWISAVDDTPSASADRSHPAFFLPAQHYSSNPATGYVNERGYWTLDPCVASGDACVSDEDCCGGTGTSPTASCRVDLPLSTVVTRHCAGLPSPSQCAPVGSFCQTDSDCCSGTYCIAQSCATPPPTPTYQQTYYTPANFHRVFQATCPPETQAQWDFLFWTGLAPLDSSVEFYVQVSQTDSGFATLPVAPAAVNTSGVVSVGKFDASWMGPQNLDIYTPLSAAGVALANEPYLDLTMRFVPSSDGTATPSLDNWKVSYSCSPSQ